MQVDGKRSTSYDSMEMIQLERLSSFLISFGLAGI